MRGPSVEASVRILPELRAIVDATSVVGTTTWLVTQFGRPFTAEGFGNKMAEWCKKAGLAGNNSHGIRKAAATRARSGAHHARHRQPSEHRHQLAQAELYARDAERRHRGQENSHLLGTKG